jgi:hypothetical protein
MKNKVPYIAALLTALIGVAQATTVTVTVEDDGVSNIGANGTFYWALTNCNAGDTIAFNIPGAGPHYLKPPVGGFPLVYQKHNLTIDGYTEPGSAVNTAAITATNNAVIKIVLDSRNANFTDMAYVFYGSLTVSVPPINNAPLYGDGSTTVTGRERGGYDPESVSPYLPGEVATLGIYRSTNVTVKGLAFVAGGATTSAYLLAVAQDFGYDTTIRDRFDYNGGSSRGFHLAGCWFGIDPGTGADAGSGQALAMFRHRDRSGLTAATRRPSSATDVNDEGVPNGEGASIGVKPGAANPRAEFNVFGNDLGVAIGAELARTRISGNQLLAPTDIGRYSDSKVPSMLFGTDGDGVNDADEGNLFLATPEVYNTQNKVYVFAGNIFNLERNGSRPGAAMGFAVDGIRLDQGTMVRFGSDLNGVSDALEGNAVYDLPFAFNAGGSAPSNGSWLSMRRNTLVNCVEPPIFGNPLAYYDKFMEATLSDPHPVIAPSSTLSQLVGTCATNKAPYNRVFIDLYVADPEGDLATQPQGKTYLGTFEDNGAGDANPAVGAFTFNISSLAIASGTKVTATANYTAESKPSLSVVSIAGTDVTLQISGGVPTYEVSRASVITGPWTNLGLFKLPGNVIVPASGDTAFYRVAATSFAQQTSPFATSVALNP